MKNKLSQRCLLVCLITILPLVMVCSEEAKKQEENIDDLISIDDLIKECQPHEHSAVLSNEQKVLYKKADSTLKKELEKIRNIYKKHYERSSCVKASDCDMVGLDGRGAEYVCDSGDDVTDPLLRQPSLCPIFPISKNALKEYQNEVNPVKKQCRALVNGCEAIVRRTSSYLFGRVCYRLAGTELVCVENKCIITAY